MKADFSQDSCSSSFIPSCIASLSPFEKDRAGMAKAYGDMIHQALVECHDNATKCIQDHPNVPRANLQLIEDPYKKILEYRGVDAKAIIDNQATKPICTDTAAGFCGQCKQLFDFCRV